REDYTIAGVAGLDLHHLYRAMAWLGEELPEQEQDGRTPFAPRCRKDVVEERLFAHRRDLLTRLDLVFMDTTMECALDSGQFQASGFDRLLGVAILVLRGAQIA